MLKRCVAGLVLAAATSWSVPALADPAPGGGPSPLPVPKVESAVPLKSSTLPPTVEALPTPSEPAAIGNPSQDPLLDPNAVEPGKLEPDRLLSVKYFKGYLTDTGKILSAPLHFDAMDWLKVGVVGGVTSGLFLVDSKVKDFAQGHHSTVLDKFSTVGNDLGNPLYTLPPLGAFYVYGLMNDDAKARKTALLALESYVISGALTDGLKILVQRHRPNTGDSPGTLDGPKLSLGNLSFCSGHTSSAFSLATVIADQYQDHPWVPPVAYGLATLTGLSRIYSNAHWSSDAVFGAALGYFVSKGVLSLHKDHPTQNRLTVMPSLDKDMTGVTVQCTF